VALLGKSTEQPVPTTGCGSAGLVAGFCPSMCIASPLNPVSMGPPTSIPSWRSRVRCFTVPRWRRPVSFSNLIHGSSTGDLNGCQGSSSDTWRPDHASMIYGSTASIHADCVTASKGPACGSHALSSRRLRHFVTRTYASSGLGSGWGLSGENWLD